jgi:hypothetical protein
VQFSRRRGSVHGQAIEKPENHPSIPAVASAARTHKITLEIHSAPEGAELLLNNVLTSTLD